MNEFGRTAHLDAAKRRDGFEYDQNAAGITGQVAELYVALCNDYLKGFTCPAKPDGRNQGAPILLERREDSWRRILKQRMHALCPALRQGRIVMAELRGEGTARARASRQG
jgi:hypothetical protein